MIDLNKKDNDDDEKLVTFLDICAFINTYSVFLKACLCLFLFIVLCIFGIYTWFYRIILAFILGNLIFQIICLFTVDKQYDVIHDKLKYPLIIKDIAIDKNDELANVGNPEPKIPGLNLSYDVKTKGNDIFAVAFLFDEKHFKVLTSVECTKEGKNFIKKIESDTLFNCFDGLKRDNIYANQCLILNIIKLKENKNIEDLDIIDIEDTDDTLIITRCVYYPYIK